MSRITSVGTVSKKGTWILKYNSLESMEVHGEHCSPPRFWPWIFGQRPNL